MVVTAALESTHPHAPPEQRRLVGTVSRTVAWRWLVTTWCGARRQSGRSGRLPGLRTAKTTLAAVLAFLVAEKFGTSPQPVLAPLTALLVAQLTTYQTVASGLERVASVLVGVLLAVGVASLVGLTWWSLGGVVALSLILGRLLRLGPNLLEVPISAMIVLAVGGDPRQAEGRVYETLIGAAVGVAVNLVVAPPLQVRPAAAALAELAERLAEVLRGLAGDLRGEWSRTHADRWLERARAVGAEVGRADRALVQAEQSSRLNPRGAVVRHAQPRLRTGLSGLEHGYVALRSLCRALLDRTYYVPMPDQAYTPLARETLADVLEEAAEALCAVGGYASSRPGDAAAEPELDERREALRQHRDRLSALLLVDPLHDEAAWQQHGALLASIDRLRVEIDAVAAPTDQPWRPPPVPLLPRGVRRR